MSVDHGLEHVEVFSAMPQGGPGRRPGKARRVLAVILFGVLGLAAAAGLVWLLWASMPRDDAPAESAQVSEATAEGPTATGRQQTLGVQLPVSDKHGPTNAAKATGFTRTPQGAALAAAHLSVRSDAYAGPDSFGPVLRAAAGPNADRALTATSEAYKSVAAQQDVTGGKPIPAATGEIRAWRIGTFDKKAVNDVQLLVGVDGSEVVFTVPVVWKDGDWRLRPDVTDDGLVAYQLTEPGKQQFTQFYGEGQ